MQKRRRKKRATAEEVKRFEESMRSAADSKDQGINGTAGPEKRPCITDFSWLDDAVLESLSHDALLSVSIRYRDIITGMMEERKELTDAFLNLLERNNILLTDAFGRKSERLAVLLGGSRAAGGRGPEEDDGNTGEDGPVKSSDRKTEETGDGHEGQQESGGSTDESGTGQDSSTDEDGSGQDDSGGTKNEKNARTWTPKRTKGCMETQCKGLPVVEKAIGMTKEDLEKIFGKGNFCHQESNDSVIIQYEYIPETL